MLGAIWQKLKTGLARTRDLFTGVAGLFRLKGRVDEAFLAELEKRLLSADMGALVSRDLVAQVRQSFLDREITGDVEAHVRQHLRSLLGDDDRSFHLAESGPTVILIAGVNGSGKTTSIAKLANRFHKEGKKVLVAACDTFRAAAVEQVKTWGSRSGVEVIANPGQNTDPAAVVYDAIAAAKSRHIELLLVDTAGRLQNKKNLMDELAKIRRIVDKQAPEARVEALLVLDATLGQNGLRQAEVFAAAANLSGVVLTKLDGTAKGGVALAVVEQLGLPIRFIGAGEGIEDLRPFSSYEFVEALLSG